jgi:hypothetical protein
MIMRGSMALRTHCHAAVDVSMVAARMRDQCAAVKALAASAVGVRDRPLAKRAPAIAVWMQPASFSHRREVFNDALWSLDKYGPKMIVATVGLGVNAVDLTRRGVRDAGAFHWRRHLVSLILTALVAVVLPTSVVACGTSTSAGHNSPSPASNTTTSAGQRGSSSLPAGGGTSVGGDSVPPASAAPGTQPGPATGIPGPESGTPTPGGGSPDSPPSPSSSSSPTPSSPTPTPTPVLQ